MACFGTLVGGDRADSRIANRDHRPQPGFLVGRIDLVGRRADALRVAVTAGHPVDVIEREAPLETLIRGRHRHPRRRRPAPRRIARATTSTSTLIQPVSGVSGICSSHAAAPRFVRGRAAAR